MVTYVVVGYWWNGVYTILHLFNLERSEDFKKKLKTQAHGVGE